MKDNARFIVDGLAPKAMRFLVSLTLFIVCSSQLEAQVKSRGNQFAGYIILADSSRQEVAIEVEDSKQPWSFQQDVRYFDKSLLTGTRVKREVKKECIPGEIIEYGFGDRRFIHVRYYIKGVDEDNKLKEVYGKWKGEKNVDFFAEVVKNDRVSVARFHIPPAIADEDYDSEEAMQKHIEKSEKEFDVLFFRQGFSPVSVSDISFSKFFTDCPFVVKKYEEGRYAIKPIKGIKSGIESIFSPDKLLGDRVQTAVDIILRDYDKQCRTSAE